MADGSFSIDGLPPGSYTIEAEGFENGDYAFQVAPGLIDPYLPGDEEYWNEGDIADEDPLINDIIDIAAGDVYEDIVIILGSNVFNADFATMLDIDTLGPFTYDSCVKDPTDWNDFIGLETPDDTSSTNSGPAGGCSLIGH